MGKLILVPTPIGNLEDITYRAVRILKEVDLILAEDTRTTSTLLRHYEIRKPVQSHHLHNEHTTIDSILAKLDSGLTIALVSDAGTPGISDPGFLLVRETIKAGHDIEVLPGATAFVPALVASGLPCEKFIFMGFLPQKKGRKTTLESLAGETKTMVFYESPFRLIKALEELAAVLGKERQASVSRELTKIHEETQRGTLEELAAYFSKKTVKGEIVIVVEGRQKKKKENEQEEENR